MREREVVALGLVMLVLLVLVEQQASPKKEPEEPEQEEVGPKKEPEEELKEQFPLLILPQKKEGQVVPPQLAHLRELQERVEG